MDWMDDRRHCRGPKLFLMVSPPPPLPSSQLSTVSQPTIISLHEKILNNKTGSLNQDSAASEL